MSSVLPGGGLGPVRILRALRARLLLLVSKVVEKAGKEREVEAKGTISKVVSERRGLHQCQRAAGPPAGPGVLGVFAKRYQGDPAAFSGFVCLGQEHNAPVRAERAAEPRLAPLCGAGGPRPARGWPGGSRTLQPCLERGAAVSPLLRPAGRCSRRSLPGRLWVSWESCPCIWGWSRLLRAG